jgi:hypothetical protein
VITDATAAVPPTSDAGVVYLTRYAAEEQQLKSDSPAPFFLASSEKLTPELRITVDGREARAVEINSVFAGVAVPAGSHSIVFSRRIARGWWWPAGLGLLAFVLIAIVEIARAMRRMRFPAWTRDARLATP